jgi:polysaccharide export outer membrane protein
MALSGCQSPTFDDDAVKGIAPKGSTNSAGTNLPARLDRVELFRVGDTVIITYAGMDPVIPMHQDIIKDDGTISPPEIRAVVAAGKTASEVQAELLKEYKKIYTKPSVTVVPAQRFYYVLGDVMHPGPQQYLGETDVIKAIAAAGGLTEYAKKGDIQITRAGSKKVIHIDYKKALQSDPKHRLPIYPGDSIFVDRTIW